MPPYDGSSGQRAIEATRNLRMQLPLATSTHKYWLNFLATRLQVLNTINCHTGAHTRVTRKVLPTLSLLLIRCYAVDSELLLNKD